MKRAQGGDDLHPLGLSPVIKIPACQFDCRFVGFCSAVTEEHLVGKTLFRQIARKQGLRFNMKPVGDVHEFLRLCVWL